MPINGARERALQIVHGVLAGDIQALEGVIILCPLVRSDPTIASKVNANLIVALMETESFRQKLFCVGEKSPAGSFAR